VIYRFDRCDLDVQRRELRSDGQLRSIEPQVFDLLRFLIENRDRVVSRDDIFKSVWRGRIISESGLSTRINAVRAAINDSGIEQRLLRTIRGIGFRFVGSVVEGARHDLTPRSHPTLSTIAQSGRPIVAVLSFSCSEGHWQHEQAVNELSNKIAVALSRVRWLSVVSRASSAGYGREKLDIRAIGRELGARYVLAGSAGFAGNRARFHVELIDADTGFLVWADSYDGSMTGSPSKLPDEIASQIMAAVKPRLSSAEISRSHLFNDADAWHQVLRSIPLLNSRRKPEWMLACNLLKQAIRAEPGRSQGYSLLAYALTLGVAAGWRRRREIIASALDIAQKALLLDPEDPWGHVARGFALAWAHRPEDSILSYGRALTCNPLFGYAHTLKAAALCYLGRGQDALQEIAQAERFSAGDLFTRGNMGVNNNTKAIAHFIIGRHREGIEAGRQALMESPKLPTTHRFLIANYALSDDREEGRTGLDKLRDLVPSTSLESLKEWSPFVQAGVQQKMMDAFRLVELT
jgi:TolB-like protein